MGQAGGGIDAQVLEELFETARGLVEEGPLPSIQLAVARGGVVVASRTYGRAAFSGVEREATEDALYCGFSTTKALLSSAVWLLLEDRRLATEDRVVDLIPEFDTEGKELVTVEHLLTHTAGFPDAPFDPLEWEDRERRLARFAQWRLDWEPGSRLVYHPAATMWVLAEILERKTGMDFRSFVRTRILEALGLEDLYLGLPADQNDRVAEVVHFGDAPSSESLEAMGLQVGTVLTDREHYFERYNGADYRAVGVPGGGGVMNAGSLALFYQALLGERLEPDNRSVWSAATVEGALEPRSGDLLDSMTGKRANRALGLVVAGDDERIYRAFGATNSPRAFGHPGAGGQVAWADPDTGLSFVALTNGFDRNPVGMGMRGVMLSSIAARCVERSN